MLAVLGLLLACASERPGLEHSRRRSTSGAARDRLRRSRATPAGNAFAVRRTERASTCRCVLVERWAAANGARTPSSSGVAPCRSPADDGYFTNARGTGSQLLTAARRRRRRGHDRLARSVAGAARDVAYGDTRETAAQRSRSGCGRAGPAVSPRAGSGADDQRRAASLIAFTRGGKLSGQRADVRIRRSPREVRHRAQDLSKRRRRAQPAAAIGGDGTCGGRLDPRQSAWSAARIGAASGSISKTR